MQTSTPLGLIAGLALVSGSVFLGPAWTIFLDLSAALLVLGGTGSALLVSFSIDELKQIPSALQRFLYFDTPDFQAHVDQFSDLARTARRDGLLALDRQLDEIDNELTRLGLELAIDGSDADEITGMLNRKSNQITKTIRLLVDFFNKGGMYAPAFGMIGTLIGLIQMLQDLTDPAQIGEGMALALLTTLYGALLANLALLPIARKAQAQLDQTLRVHRMARTGILAIVRGDRPSMIERRLEVFVGEDGDAESDKTDSSPEEEPLSKAA